MHSKFADRLPFPCFMPYSRCDRFFSGDFFAFCEEAQKSHQWVRAFGPDVWAETQTHLNYLQAKS